MESVVITYHTYLILLSLFIITLFQSTFIKQMQILNSGNEEVGGWSEEDKKTFRFLFSVF